MSGRIVRGAQAKRDLVQHYVYLAEQANLETARRFLASVESACALLAEMPNLGAPRTFAKPALNGIRVLPVRQFREYLIFYKPISGGIRLFRVIHSKQDYPRVLGESSFPI